MTSAGVHALSLVEQALIDPGDRVVIVTPVWPNLTSMPRILSAEVVRVALECHGGAWSLDIQRLLDAATPDTRLVLVNSPNNPTGWTMPQHDWNALLAHCRRHGIWLVADDAYERLVFEPELTIDGHAPGVLGAIDDEDRVISANTFSKSWTMTGWRLGWLVAPRSFIAQIGKVIEFNTSCAPGFVQQAGIVAVRDGDALIAQTVARLRASRDRLVRALAATAGRRGRAAAGRDVSLLPHRRTQRRQPCVREAPGRRSRTRHRARRRVRAGGRGLPALVLRGVRGVARRRRSAAGALSVDPRARRSRVERRGGARPRSRSAPHPGVGFCPVLPLRVAAELRPMRIAAHWLAGAVGAARRADTFGGGGGVPFSDEELRRVVALGPWPPKFQRDPSNRVSGHPLAIALGRLLFFDPRMSPVGYIACVSCHAPDRAFADLRPRAHGLADLERNTIALANLRQQHWYDWAGSSDSLWLASLRPILNPREFDGSPASVARLFRRDEALAQCYRRVFGIPPAGDDERTLVNVGKALAAFLETLNSGRTAFDDYRDSLARGEPAPALYPVAARRGLKLFVGSAGCDKCHSGANLSDGDFHDAGAPPPVAPARRDPGRAEGARLLLENRFNRFGRYSDDARPAAPRARIEAEVTRVGQFRTPSLRNVAVIGSLHAQRPHRITARRAYSQHAAGAHRSSRRRRSRRPRRLSSYADGC